MLKKETKKAIALLMVAMALLASQSVFATDYSSTNFTVKDPVIDEGTSSTSSANFGLGQSIGQLGIGKSTSTNFQLWSGFQYFFKVNANVLTATPGAGQASLSWTAPTTFLGITVGSYEVGTGTISGSYVFENVGSVTTFIKSGLTAGTTYYFIIKALSPGGNFLVFSNEATAVPTAAGGGGGGGGGYGNQLTFNGIAYPNSLVTLVQDVTIAATTTAATSGYFSMGLNGLSNGTYNFSLYAADSTGNLSPNLNTSRTISSGVAVVVNDLIIAPTIHLSYSTIKQGESLTISGYTAPSVPVTINISGQANVNVTSDANGYYSYLLDTTALIKAVYQVFSHALVGSINSPNSFTLSFEVGDTSVPTPSPECKRSDLNCDGWVNLIDFSILLYFWDDTNPFNPRADIDKSGKVGLRDFSIMLYDWTG